MKKLTSTLKYGRYFANKSNIKIQSFQKSNTFSFRCFASAPDAKGATPSSFVRGLFLGELYDKEVFPFPETLSKEAKENLDMLIPATQQFFQEEVDSKKNDELAKIPDDQWQKMKELGLFGLQVPQEHGGLGLTNVGYARMVEIVGAVDLGVGIALGGKKQRT